MKTVMVDDGDIIVFQRRHDLTELARIEITDKLVPRGEQVLRTYSVIFPERWIVLGTDDCGNNKISIQLCSKD